MTQELIERLEPCPFCGSDNIDAREDGSPFSIRCLNCCAEMPYMSLDDPQSVRWNTRDQSQSARIAELDAECERAWAAYRMAHDQAMSNGQALADLRSSLTKDSTSGGRDAN